MESERSVLIIFTYEEQSCLILDSISNPVFIIQSQDFNCRFLILGLPDFLWIEPNEHNWTELNKYNKREFTKMRTKLTTKLCKYIVNTVTLRLVIAVAKLSKVMQASPWKTIIAALGCCLPFFYSIINAGTTISASNGGFGSPLQEIIFLVYKKSAQMEWF